MNKSIKKYMTVLTILILSGVFCSIAYSRLDNSLDNYFGLTLKQFNCDMDFLNDEQQIQLANDIFKGQLVVSPSFQNNSPSYSLKTLDWNIQYSDSPNTFQLYLQSLNCIKYLAKGYELSGNTKYLDLGKAFVYSWTEYDANKTISENNPFTWYDHGTALRADNLIYLALVCEKAQYLDQKFIEVIQNLIEAHGECLSNNTYYTKNHNHGIFQDQALIYIAYFLNDEKKDSYLSLAKERLEKQKQYAFNSELVHVENSPGYQVGVLNIFRNISEFLLQFNDPFGKELFDDVAQSAEFMAWVTKPNGLTAEIGDTNGALNIETNIDTGLSSFGNAHLTYAATQGTEGMAPRENCVIYPQSGYFMAREHWNREDFNLSTWSVFKAGYSSKTHKHADDLSIMLYSKGHDIFVDPGWYNYITGNKYRDYFVSSRAHNSIIVDGRTYSATEENSEKTGILDYRIGDDYNYALGFNDMYQGVQIDRHYYELNDAIILYDNIESENEHTYSQIFHLSEDMNIISATDRETKLQIADTGYTVRIRQMGEIEPRMRIIHGDYQENQFGYISREMNHLDSIDTLKYDVQGSNSDFITIITIEDARGLVKLTKSYDPEQVYLPANQISFNPKTMQLSVGITQINLQKRLRFRPDQITLQQSFNHIYLRNLVQEPGGLSYAWYIVDKGGQVVYKSDYSESPNLDYEMQGQSEYFIKAYIKSKLGQRKYAIVAVLRYDPQTMTYKNVTEEYPYLNLIYYGHEYEETADNTYRFKVNFDYSWDYSIKWYVYRDGGYYYSTTTDQKEFTYTFDEPGRYTVMYYLNTINGEKEFWNFEQIDI